MHSQLVLHPDPPRRYPANNLPVHKANTPEDPSSIALATMGDQGPIFFFKPDDLDHGWLCQWYWSPFTAEIDGKILEFKHAEQ